MGKMNTMQEVINAFGNCINENALDALTPAQLKTIVKMFPDSIRGRQGERTLEQVQNLMGLYTDKGGYVVTLQEGVLGYGLTLLVDFDCVGLKTFVIKEYPCGEWSCTHTVRGYNKMPAKYAKMLDGYMNSDDDE